MTNYIGTYAFGTYIAVVCDNILPEVSYRELLSYDDRDPKYHHKADAHDPARGVVQGQRVVEDWVFNAAQVE